MSDVFDGVRKWCINSRSVKELDKYNISTCICIHMRSLEDELK